MLENLDWVSVISSIGGLLYCLEKGLFAAGAAWKEWKNGRDADNDPRC